MSAARPSAWLLRRIPQVTAAAPGGGCSKTELAAALRVRETDKTFDVSVWVCYRRHAIDLCRGYVVAPARAEEARVEVLTPKEGPP